MNKLLSNLLKNHKKEGSSENIPSELSLNNNEYIYKLLLYTKPLYVFLHYLIETNQYLDKYNGKLFVLNKKELIKTLSNAQLLLKHNLPLIFERCKMSMTLSGNDLKVFDSILKDIDHTKGILAVTFNQVKVKYKIDARSLENEKATYSRDGLIHVENYSKFHYCKNKLSPREMMEYAEKQILSTSKKSMNNVNNVNNVFDTIFGRHYESSSFDECSIFLYKYLYCMNYLYTGIFYYTRSEPEKSQSQSIKSLSNYISYAKYLIPEYGNNSVDIPEMIRKKFGFQKNLSKLQKMHSEVKQALLDCNVIKKYIKVDIATYEKKGYVEAMNNVKSEISDKMFLKYWDEVVNNTKIHNYCFDNYTDNVVIQVNDDNIIDRTRLRSSRSPNVSKNNFQQTLLPNSSKMKSFKSPTKTRTPEHTRFSKVQAKTPENSGSIAKRKTPQNENMSNTYVDQKGKRGSFLINRQVSYRRSI